MGDFASSLQSQVTAAVSSAIPDSPSSSATAVAEPPAASPATSTPASTPPPTPASPTAPTPAETPISQEEDDFSWDGLDKPEAAPEIPAATPEQPQPTADDPANWKAEDIDQMLPKQVIDKMLQTQKGRNIYQSYMTMREMEKPVSEGGLGFRPSIEQMRQMHEEASGVKQMLHEFQNPNIVVPDPVNPGQTHTYGQNFIKQWFGVNEQGQPQPHALAVAAQLAPTLDRYSPDLYRAVARPIIGNYIEERYRAAEQEQDPDMRVALFNVARIIEGDITGKARDVPEDVWKSGKPMQPQANPELEEIRRGRMEIERFHRDQAQATSNAFVARMNGGIRDGLSKDIRFALKPVADAYKGADDKPSRAYAALEDKFHNEVVQWANQNPAAMRNYVIARDLARGSGNPNDIQNAARAWVAAVRPYMEQLRKEYIKDTSARKVAESNSRHRTLAEASQKRGSTSIGQPTEKTSAADPMKPQPGESFRDTLQRLVETRVSAA